MSVLGPAIDALHAIECRAISGRVVSVRGLSILVNDLPLPVGAVVRLMPSTVSGTVPGGNERIRRGEVVGFEGSRSIVMLFDSSEGIARGAQVVGEQCAPVVAAGRSLMGRVVDGLGRPIDGGPALTETIARALNPPPVSPLDRRPIDEPLITGVRAVDALVTLGRGQRVGVFSGPGVGKSTLLGTIARNTAADVNVIALVGERGREVRDFIESTLGPEGLARSVLVVATSDESPLLRVRAAFAACAIAEHFRDDGQDVMLIMDSITRFAQAQRQIGLTIGEQPATKGYTPSVFAMMPKLLERAGAIEGGGSITGIYAVLVEGDDLTEPVSDTARGILDGHLTLSRRLASRGHYPALDLLDSVSRVADDVCDANHIAARRAIVRLLAAYRESEELINIGAYARGSNPDCDVAIAMRDEIDTFLRQDSGTSSPYPETCRRLVEMSLTAQAVAQKLNDTIPR